jgi:hypothetical protein
MSGAEVLGILGGLAATSQFAQQSLKVINFISDLDGKVRDAPESIRKQAVQVEQPVCQRINHVNQINRLIN